MIPEDDVDLETLQAQIDTSMSFAHDLVTSWIKPNSTRIAHIYSNGVNVSQLLDEDLRRPPRLGVGASISAVPLLANEASKLKRKLGKNSAKNEDVRSSQLRNPFKLDEEEHKGRPSKRKIKVDPFGREGSKKRKASSQTNSYLSAEDVSKSHFFLENPSVREPENREKQCVDHGTQNQQSVTSVSSPSMRLSVHTALSSCLTTRSCLTFSARSRETSDPVPENITTIAGSNRIPASSMPIRDKAKPLGIPLLNLDGPPQPTGKTGDVTELNCCTKKRKRRKKKKTGINISAQRNPR